MSRRFAIYLGCTGALGLLAIAVPATVMVGLWAGIIPGLIIGFAPTLFIYSIAWWLIRELLLRSSLMVRRQSGTGKKGLRWTAGAVAFVILMTPAILVPRALNAPIARAAAELRIGDQEPGGPLALPPVVGIVGTYGWSGKTPLCDTLCQRLLYNGAVSRIIAADDIPPRAERAFWIERGTQPCPQPPVPRSDVVFPDDYKSKKHRPGGIVQERTAAGECLIGGAGELGEAALTISYEQIKKGVSPFDAPWTLALDAVSAARLEIDRADGQLVYRRTEVKTEPLFVPLVIGVGAGLFTTVTYAGWGRSKKTYSEIGPRGRDVLPAVLGPAVRLPD